VPPKHQELTAQPHDITYRDWKYLQWRHHESFKSCITYLICEIASTMWLHVSGCKIIYNTHCFLFLGVTKLLRIRSKYTHQQQQCSHKRELATLLSYQAAPNVSIHTKLCQPTGSPSLLYLITY